ncbi:alpha/beta fold hydrolase [Diaminobutyricimonas sp. TR449]|uniref:alpha/beta fold hydrolase n=1 Tax=Diaminobutyricimonas sp. TR449 TaxID=2708076 RepID=UPI001AB04FE4|nr:alpha/beta fold hydrolase [Diaminobutyricimonas sp. TR449]
MNGNKHSASTSLAGIPEVAGVTHSFVDLPGLRMHVAEAGEGDPVLLLHGAPQNWWEWHEIMPELAKTHRVIAPDLRGAGWTDVPPRGYTREQLLADLVNLLDALRLDRVQLIAHDWSAFVGFQLCLRHPERVRSFLCLSVPHIYAHVRPTMIGADGLGLEAAMLSGFGGRSMKKKEQRIIRHMFHHFSADPSIWTEDRMEPFRIPNRDPRHARALTSLYRHFIGIEALRIMFGKYRSTFLTTPTRLLIGAQDRQIPAEMLVGYEGHAADLRIERPDGAAHWLPDERPDAVIEAARKLFAVT